jgi:hypothetical protein
LGGLQRRLCRRRCFLRHLGYLIAGILAAEIAQNRFSIIAFYERRIRRIFPCLLAVIIASSIAAAILLVPMDCRDFAKSVVATLFFASNVLFFRQSGYFDEQSEMKPMLHTWSLAVEEQYYILFPILLWLIHRYARDRMFLLLVPLAFRSFRGQRLGRAAHAGLHLLHGADPDLGVVRRRAAGARPGAIDREARASRSAVLVGVVALALAGIASNGWAGRFPEEVARLEGYATAYNPRREECHRDEEVIIPMENSCVYGAVTPPAFAVWGDSHAIELTLALGEVAARHQKAVMQFTYSSCPPSLGLEVRVRPNSREYNDTAVAFWPKIVRSQRCS